MENLLGFVMGHLDPHSVREVNFVNLITYNITTITQERDEIGSPKLVPASLMEDVIMSSVRPSDCRYYDNLRRE